LRSAAFGADKGRTLPSEGVRYADPATEFAVERFTDPAYPSIWPYPYARALAKQGAFFVFSSDRGEGMQAFRYELKKGEMRQLTDIAGLQPQTLNILPGDRAFTFVAGRSVYLAPFGSLREREVYRIPDDWELGEGFSVALDGVYAVLVERQQNRSRLQLLGMSKGNVTTLVEHEGVLRHPQPRPKRASVAYLKDAELHLINYDGSGAKQLITAPCLTSPGSAFWTRDGRSILFLAENEKRMVWIQESIPDSGQVRPFASTTQFGNFAPNPDGSVMVAATRSIAQPHIVIMVRSAKRELTLCEHKASDPAAVAPVFSPTSQRIYFQSDRHGKPAIYSVVIDKFIEKTDS
jgi:oligogalacturonide lyase